MSPVRSFTPDEAKAALPHIKPILVELREAFHDYRFARQQAEEMWSVHGDSLDSRGHPDHAEYREWRAKETSLEARVRALVERINDLGADVKDPILGLIDFPHVRPDGEVVLLCYRDDEKDLAYWHPQDRGFAGRRPLSEL